MADYDSFGELYDIVVGEREDLAQFIRALVTRYASKARTLLELGCGSGSLLKVFSRHFVSSGIDLSPAMIALARKRAPRASTEVGDITAFDMGKRFDVVVCAFDTMNHLPSWRDWQRAFRCAARHVHPDGVYIFDVNTAFKLERYATEPAVAEKHNGHVTVVDVVRRGKDRYVVRLTALSSEGGDRYRRRDLEIPELTVPTKRIVMELRKSFRFISIVDPDRRRPGEKSEELFFVCRRPRRAVR